MMLMKGGGGFQRLVRHAVLGRSLAAAVGEEEELSYSDPPPLLPPSATLISS